MCVCVCVCECEYVSVCECVCECEVQQSVCMGQVNSPWRQRPGSGPCHWDHHNMETLAVRKVEAVLNACRSTLANHPFPYHHAEWVLRHDGRVHHAGR